MDVGANSAVLPSSVFLTDRDKQGLSGIYDEQWKIIQCMLGNSSKPETLSGKMNGIEWILDTGEPHHMTGRLDILEDVHSILPVSVKLHAGSNVFASKQGIVRLNSRLVLYNVYLVDGFDMNLISFGQLVTDNYLVGQITDTLLVLQNRTMKTLTGVGEREREGLYRFCRIAEVTSLHTKVREDSVFWHNRLDHPSSRVVGLIPGVSSNSDFLKNAKCAFV